MSQVFKGRKGGKFRKERSHLGYNIYSFMAKT